MQCVIGQVDAQVCLERCERLLARWRLSDCGMFGEQSQGLENVPREIAT